MSSADDIHDMDELTDPPAGCKVDFIGGFCPVQAEGNINGHRFYFRARGTVWTFHIQDGQTNREIWMAFSRYGDDPYAAGWMPLKSAWEILVQSMRSFLDGQPCSSARYQHELLQRQLEDTDQLLAETAYGTDAYEIASRLRRSVLSKLGALQELSAN